MGIPIPILRAPCSIRTTTDFTIPLSVLSSRPVHGQDAHATFFSREARRPLTQLTLFLPYCSSFRQLSTLNALPDHVWSGTPDRRSVRATCGVTDQFVAFDTLFEELPSRCDGTVFWRSAAADLHVNGSRAVMVVHMDISSALHRWPDVVSCRRPADPSRRLVFFNRPARQLCVAADFFLRQFAFFGRQLFLVALLAFGIAGLVVRVGLAFVVGRLGVAFFAVLLITFAILLRVGFAVGIGLLRIGSLLAVLVLTVFRVARRGVVGFVGGVSGLLVVAVLLLAFVALAVVFGIGRITSAERSRFVFVVRAALVQFYRRVLASFGRDRPWRRPARV